MTDLNDMGPSPGVLRWRNLTEGAERDIDLDAAPVIRRDPWYGTCHCEEEGVLVRALHRFRASPEVREVVIDRLQQVWRALAEEAAL